MIVTLILNIFYAFVTLLLSILPVGNLPEGFIEGLNYFWGVINTFSYIIPVDTMLQALLVVLAFDLAILLWHFLQWIIRKIPGMH